MNSAENTETATLIKDIFDSNENIIDDKTRTECNMNINSPPKSNSSIGIDEKKKLFESIESKLRSLQSGEVTCCTSSKNGTTNGDAVIANNTIMPSEKHCMDMNEDVIVMRDAMEYEEVHDRRTSNTVVNEPTDDASRTFLVESLSSVKCVGETIDANDGIICADTNHKDAFIDPSDKNNIENNEFLTKNDAVTKRISNKFTLARGTNAIYHPLNYIQICGECKHEITNKERHLSWECMEFCNEDCLSKFQTTIGKQCANCIADVPLSSLGKYCVRFGYDIRQFCKSNCLDTFKKGHKVCCYCQTFIVGQVDGVSAATGDSNQFKDFCTQTCMEKYYKMSHGIEKTVASCDVCNEEKLIRLEIEVDNVVFKLCSEPCFVAFKFANNVVTEQCNMCRKYYEQTTLDFTIYLDKQPMNFCGKTCQNMYIISNRKIVACHWCKVKKYNFDMIKQCCENGQTLLVCSINCLALCKLSMNSISVKNSSCVVNLSNQFLNNMTNSNSTPAQDIIQMPHQESPQIPLVTNVHSLAKLEPSKSKLKVPISPISISSSPSPPPVETKTQATSPVPHLSPKFIQQLVVQPPPICKVKNKSTMCKPNMHTKGISFKPLVSFKETQSDSNMNSGAVIIPVPVPIYIPMPVVTASAAFPIPVPFPLPVPVPIFIPTTRNSAKGILKEIKKIQVNLPSDPYEAELLIMAEMVAEDKKVQTDSENEDETNPINNDLSNQVYSDDILEMALNMATEPAIDLEGALITNTISINHLKDERDRAKLQKRLSGAKQKKDVYEPLKVIETPSSPQEVVDETDATMSLKYSFGVNAWKQWVSLKNIDLEKTSRRFKPIKPDLLQLSADELNYSLSMFITEIRKPNDTEYAPDTIYYLCLGIQYYLHKNGRVDNIFTDIFYEKFTECLDTIAQMFTVLYNDSHYIVTRVEEEHLWESKQLGAHSPQVLLNTLVFFNTKYFNLTTVDDHMQLSFSHIMKHWKRNPNQSGTKGCSASRNVLLRYYPAPSMIKGNMKKVYEQEENEENPLRCPVKLYEFYLSKCPESVKTRTDVFYVSPERSCLPDSPVWYSTLPLDCHALEKMLHRVKMVKEINIALLRG